MPTLLVVHHTTSPSLQSMLDAIGAGCIHDELADVTVVTRPALSATPSDVLSADGIVLGTPAYIGYMSGALKYFFDQIYYPCLNATSGMSYGLYVHGNNDTTGAVRAIQTIVTGMDWSQVHNPVTVTGPVTRDDEQACQDLGATVAARLLGWA